MRYNVSPALVSTIYEHKKIWGAVRRCHGYTWHSPSFDLFENRVSRILSISCVEVDMWMCWWMHCSSHCMRLSWSWRRIRMCGQCLSFCIYQESFLPITSTSVLSAPLPLPCNKTTTSANRYKGKKKSRQHSVCYFHHHHHHTTTTIAIKTITLMKNSILIFFLRNLFMVGHSLVSAPAAGGSAWKMSASSLLVTEKEIRRKYWYRATPRWWCCARRNIYLSPRLPIPERGIFI